MRKAALSLIAMATSLIITSGVALATITPTGNASSIASATATNASFVTGANFEAVPPNGGNAVSDSQLAGFPTNGPDYGILTTGDPGVADDPNDLENSGADLGGGNVRGDTDYDVTVLKTDLNVPSNANCLSVDFRFLSEEYPEYVGSAYNDAFIAELDNSTWTTSGSTISAPENFAFDPNGDVISINSSGVASMSDAEAQGTTYDGATQLLQAKSPITPGQHSLYLSIFDQGDAAFDSAVFVDGLDLYTASSANCEKGAQVDGTDPSVTITTPPDGASYTLGQAVNADYACEDEAGGSGIASCEGPMANGSPIDTSTPGTKTFQVTATDNAGNTASLNHTYTVTDEQPPPDPCTINGTSGNDTLKGTSGPDVICGLGGNDTLKGVGGNDDLLGGDGTDTALFAGKKAVDASLAAGSAVGVGSDTLAGIENLTGSSAADTLTGDGGPNKLVGGGGNDTVLGGGGNDTVIGGSGNDALHGEDGNDTVNSRDGVSGNDSLDGGAGTDKKITDATEASIVGFP